MQAVTSETESKSLDLSICVHHYTLRAPCPKGQGILWRRAINNAPELTRIDCLRSQHNSRPGCFRVRAFSTLGEAWFKPGVVKRTQFLPASAYLRFFLSSNRVPERGSSTQAYIVNR